MMGQWGPLLAVAALAASGISRAHGADGLYLGAGLGAAAVRDSFDVSTFEAEDLAYKAFIGWRFDNLPLIDVAVEAAYTNFGKPSQVLAPSAGAPAEDVEFKLHGPSAAGLLILPLGPLDLYAKGGVIKWRLDQTIGGSTTGRSGTDAFYGAGAGIYLWKLGFRVEYERYQIKDVDRVEMLSAGVLFQF